MTRFFATLSLVSALLCISALSNQAYAGESCSFVRPDTFGFPGPASSQLRRQRGGRYDTTVPGEQLNRAYVDLQLEMMARTGRHKPSSYRDNAMMVFVHPDKYAANRFLSLPLNLDEIVCVLGKGVGVSISDGRANHLTIAWVNDRAKREVSFLEEVPEDSPLLAGHNLAGVHGRLVRQGDLTLVAVPWDEVKTVITGLSLFARTQDVNRLFAAAPDTAARRERASILYAAAAFQCDLTCLPDDFPSDGIFSMEEPFQIRAFFSMFATNLHLDGKDKEQEPFIAMRLDSILRSPYTRRWPADDALLLARASLGGGYLDPARTIVRNLQQDKLAPDLAILSELLLAAADYFDEDGLMAERRAGTVIERASERLRRYYPDHLNGNGHPIDNVDDGGIAWALLATIHDAAMLSALISLENERPEMALQHLALLEDLSQSDPLPLLLATLAASDAGNFPKAKKYYARLLLAIAAAQKNDSEHSVLGRLLIDSSIKDKATGYSLRNLVRWEGDLERRLQWRCVGTDQNFATWLMLQGIKKTALPEKCRF